MRKIFWARGWGGWSSLILQAVQVGVVLHPADLNSLGRRNGTDRVPLSQQTRSSQSIWGRKNTATIQKQNQNRKKEWGSEEC
jgi:hypothetical protein